LPLDFNIFAFHSIIANYITFHFYSMLFLIILQLILLTEWVEAVICFASLSKCPAVCSPLSTTQCECTDGRSACDMSFESCLNDNLGGCQDIVTTVLPYIPSVTSYTIVATDSSATGTSTSTEVTTATTTILSTTVVTGIEVSKAVTKLYVNNHG